jgi:hypothetical protein
MITSAVSRGNKIVPNGITKLQYYKRFIFPEKNYKDGLFFVVSLLIIYFRFGIEVWLIPFGIM